MITHIGGYPDSAYFRQRQVHLAPPTSVASAKSDPGIESGFPDLFGFRCPPDRSQNLVDSFPCWRQSLRHENRPVTV